MKKRDIRKKITTNNWLRKFSQQQAAEYQQHLWKAESIIRFLSSFDMIKKDEDFLCVKVSVNCESAKTIQ